MTEPGAVPRARDAVRTGRARSEVIRDLLAAYDELAASVREREIAAYRQGYTDRGKERDYDPGSITASVREREAAAWDEGFSSGIAYQAGSYDIWRNPYLKGKTDGRVR